MAVLASLISTAAAKSVVREATASLGLALAEVAEQVFTTTSHL